jgi:RNA polymerase sigma-70 factor, ECF subfamily
MRGSSIVVSSAASVPASALMGVKPRVDAEEPGLDVAEVYRKYGPMVFRRCRRLLGDEDEALDVAQEVFVRLLQHRQRLTAQYPSSLLFRIATNLSLNRLRDRRRGPALPGDEVLHRIAVREDLDSPLLLDRLFRRHPESTRTMAVLHHVDGMTLEEVARECRLSVSGVRKRLRALRRSLDER